MTNYDAKLNEHLDAVCAHFPNNNFFYIGLCGSQNYGLAADSSDVDTKCIILPTLYDAILGKPKISADIMNPSDDGGICSAKDIREMFSNFYKGNINFVEILYTEWALENAYFLEEIQELRESRDLIANRDIPHLFTMIKGMASKHFNDFEKVTDVKREILYKYGYSPKQLYQVARLYYFLKDYIKTQDFKAALCPADKVIREEIVGIKTNPVPHRSADALKNYFLRGIFDLIEDNVDKFKLAAADQERKDREVKELLDSIAYRVIIKNAEKEQSMLKI